MILPFCDEDEYSTCLIEKDTLGTYYGCVDALITMFFLVGYLWVSAFIKDEFETIKRTTVTAGGRPLNALSSMRTSHASRNISPPSTSFTLLVIVF